MQYSIIVLWLTSCIYSWTVYEVLACICNERSAFLFQILTANVNTRAQLQTYCVLVPKACMRFTFKCPHLIIMHVIFKLMILNLLPMHRMVFICVCTSTIPYEAFLFQIHSSWVTEYPSGLQPLGDSVNMHWWCHCWQALWSPEDTPSPHNCTHLDGPAWSGQEGGSSVVGRGAHTSGKQKHSWTSLKTTLADRFNWGQCRGSKSEVLSL